MAGLSFWWRNFYRIYRYAHRIFTRLAEKYWPKGKFRPFILYAAIPAALIARSSLSPPPLVCRLKRRLPPPIYDVWTFIQSDELLVWRDDPAITKNPNERAQLAAYRQGGQP